MLRFENRTLSDEDCHRRLHAREQLDALHFSQNETVENLEFVNCKLIGCGLVTYGAPIERSIARQIRVTNCSVNAFTGIGAIFDDVVVDGLRTSHAPVNLSGCAFRHVVMRGTIGSILFNRDRDFAARRGSRNGAFRRANEEFYQTVDWALDISEAVAACIEIRGAIPSRLVRRNPETQFVLTREVAESRAWRDVQGYDEGTFQTAVSNFLTSGAPDTVVVAEPRSKYYQQELTYFRRLRDCGLLH